MTRIGDEDILLLQNSFQRKLNATTTDFHRYLHSYIDWEDRLIGIKGFSGILLYSFLQMSFYR